MDDLQSGLQLGMCLAFLAMAGTVMILGTLVLRLVGRVGTLMTEVAVLNAERATSTGGCGGFLAALVFALGALLFLGALLLHG